MPVDDSPTIQLDASTASTVFLPGQYVVIKEEMLAGDFVTIQNKTGTINDNQEMALQIGDIMLTTVQTMIVGWSGMTRSKRNLDGSKSEEVLPYSVANVAKLKRKYFEYIYKYMDNLYQQEDEVQQQAFLTDANAPTSTNSETTNQPPMN